MHMTFITQNLTRADKELKIKNWNVHKFLMKTRKNIEMDVDTYT